MRITEFDYELPEELIAQEPLAKRAASRMLTVERSSGALRDMQFADLPAFLVPGDVLVLNNTKVFPARLRGSSETGAGIEIFLLREIGEKIWESLARPAKRLHPGKKIVFGPDLTAEVIEKQTGGKLTVQFRCDGEIDEILDRVGKTPLPPYIKRGGGPDTDRERYQTVFARNRGAIAAPTAGLHFTPEILKNIEAAGVEVCEITLHVGYGTFEPVRVEDLSMHKVLPENYEITEQAAAKLNAARDEGRRIVAVGTTTTRTLEAAVCSHGRFVAEKAAADLTITPGYEFKAVNALLTNFHLPKSSLLVLVSTFAGRELIMKAYRHAVDVEYRFYSYGDCMLIV